MATIEEMRRYIALKSNEIHKTHDEDNKHINTSAIYARDVFRTFTPLFADIGKFQDFMESSGVATGVFLREYFNENVK